MTNSNKLNIGCIKIFQLLTLLYEDRADYDSVFNIFKDEISVQSSNHIQVCMNKYINTLKVFGIKLVKENNNKYKILSNLYSLDFTLEDLKSLSILLNSIENFPDENVVENINTFITNIKLRMNKNDKLTLNNLLTNSEYDFSFYYSNIKEQIEQCQQICKENFMIYLIYLKNGQKVQSKCNPKEVIFASRTAYLKVYDVAQRQILEIPISSILSIARLPQMVNKVEMSSTVVYKLKNRLAKTYKLKENEYSDGFDEQGNLVVINKNETQDKLLQRLMRYSFNCEIISPKALRQEMIKRINQTISQYDDVN